MSDKYILFMRGLVRESRHWGHHLDNYGKILAPIKPITLEIPGNGQYYKQKSFTSIEENVDFLRECLFEIIPKGSKLGIVAYSLGGMIGAQWLEKYPQDFSKAMLINTSFKGICPVHYRLQISSLLQLLITRFSTDPEKRERGIYKIVSNCPEKENETVKLWTEIAKSAPVSTANAIRQIFAAFKFTPKLKKPPVPTMIVASKGDRMCNYRCGEKIANHWNCPIRLHPWGGHELYHDDPEWLGKVLKEWFEDL
ncbi:MAG: alpha/beta hydrolase [Halobacteriovoraceae bacterium]|nr:alpha/beta hydrolase [Halobacteriovoraceae bacterium]MCB9093557.1 alpha/beta hydrolase [Halobacteriovoraceae bacterium]